MIRTPQSLKNYGVKITADRSLADLGYTDVIVLVFEGERKVKRLGCRKFHLYTVSKKRLLRFGTGLNVPKARSQFPSHTTHFRDQMYAVARSSKFGNSRREILRDEWYPSSLRYGLTVAIFQWQFKKPGHIDRVDEVAGYAVIAVKRLSGCRMSGPYSSLVNCCNEEEVLREQPKVIGGLAVVCFQASVALPDWEFLTNVSIDQQNLDCYPVAVRGIRQGKCLYRRFVTNPSSHTFLEFLIELKVSARRAADQTEIGQMIGREGNNHIRITTRKLTIRKTVAQRAEHALHANCGQIFAQLNTDSDTLHPTQQDFFHPDSRPGKLNPFIPDLVPAAESVISTERFCTTVPVLRQITILRKMISSSFKPLSKSPPGTTLHISCWSVISAPHGPPGSSSSVSYQVDFCGGVDQLFNRELWLNMALHPPDTTQANNHPSWIRSSPTKDTSSIRRDYERPLTGLVFTLEDIGQLLHKINPVCALGSGEVYPRFPKDMLFTLAKYFHLQPLNDKKNLNQRNLGESLDPVYQSVNPRTLQSLSFSSYVVMSTEAPKFSFTFSKQKKPLLQTPATAVQKRETQINKKEIREYITAIEDNVIQQPVGPIRPKGLGLGADPRVLQTPKPEENDESKKKLEWTTGAHCQAVLGKYKGKYGTVNGMDGDTGRVIVKFTISKEIASVLQPMLRLVPEKEYSKYANCLNQSEVDIYKAEEEQMQQQGEADPYKSFSSYNDRFPYSKIERDSYVPPHKPSHQPKSQDPYSWVRPKLLVRLLDRHYLNGRYYRQKVSFSI
ncbi:G patch domain and KOW motifs-containing protein [Clonorchis sinensis]|uniref:G patch domain and KOW motifs-containing protein n=1 Tax=Clonorchis sinensis TaxID=79923 RepID=G7YR58_CLOSI|nr:G patch domain and KOW motifs-containing protein [Clonorchis sinensis]